MNSSITARHHLSSSGGRGERARLLLAGSSSSVHRIHTERERAACTAEPHVRPPACLYKPRCIARTGHLRIYLLIHPSNACTAHHRTALRVLAVAGGHISSQAGRRSLATTSLNAGRHTARELAMAAVASPTTTRLVAAASTLVLLLLLPSPSTAQQQPAAAPGPAGGGMDSACMNSLLNMSDCLTYVTKGSNARRPDTPCCPELAGLVDSNPVCLCVLLSGAADSYGIAVDYACALALPGICRVATPPVSTCTALGYDVRVGPAAAPMSGPPSPMSGISPSAEGPQFPGTSPQASPPSSTTSTAAPRRSSAVSSHLVILAVLPLAAAAAVSGML